MRDVYFLALTIMPGNILLIDDEEQLRKLLSRIISLEGFKVEQAGTLKSGYHVLKEKEIDIVLCDVRLPDGNGVDFVKQAKAKYPLRGNYTANRLRKYCRWGSGCKEWRL